MPPRGSIAFAERLVGDVRGRRPSGEHQIEREDRSSGIGPRVPREHRQHREHRRPGGLVDELDVGLLRREEERPPRELALVPGDRDPEPEHERPGRGGEEADHAEHVSSTTESARL